MSRPFVLDEVLLGKVIALCKEAGQAILQVYNQQQEIVVDTKADDSPVTAADLAAHRVLVRGLPMLLNGVPLLSEEGNLPPWEERQTWTSYWIVDPLDGTKEFINRNGEFTVNVALVHEGKPVLGVVYVPVLGVVYCGIRDKGAWKITNNKKQLIRCRSLQQIACTEKKFTVVASRRHGTEEVNLLIKKLEAHFGEIKTRTMGSSLKLCLVAEGEADFYPRLAPTSEWDTAAAQAVVEAAGGQVYKRDLNVMRYNTKENILNSWFYVVGDPADFPWRKLLQE